MPYIDPNARERLLVEGARFPKLPVKSGELNYLITTLILAQLGAYPHYEDFNAVIGVLECVKQELYRRMVAPYEDQKASINGDVYA